MPEEFDEVTLNEIKTIMKSKFNELVVSYLENSKDYISSIVEGVANKDCQAIEAAAHPLKSSSATLGVMGVSVIASEIETLSRNKNIFESDDFLKFEELVKSLLSYHERTHCYFSKQITDS